MSRIIEQLKELLPLSGSGLPVVLDPNVFVSALIARELYMSPREVTLAVEQIAEVAVMVGDAGPPFPTLTTDRDDDYLVDLALRMGAVLVTGMHSSRGRPPARARRAHPGSLLPFRATRRTTRPVGARTPRS